MRILIIKINSIQASEAKGGLLAYSQLVANEANVDSTVSRRVRALYTDVVSPYSPRKVQPILTIIDGGELSWFRRQLSQYVSMFVQGTEDRLLVQVSLTQVTIL